MPLRYPVRKNNRDDFCLKRKIITNKMKKKNTILSEQFQIQLKNRRIRDKTDISNTYIHDYIHARLGTSNSIKSTGVKLVYGPKPLLLVKNVLNVLNIYIYIPKIKITKGKQKLCHKSF